MKGYTFKKKKIDTKLDHSDEPYPDEHYEELASKYVVPRIRMHFSNIIIQMATALLRSLGYCAHRARQLDTHALEEPALHAVCVLQSSIRGKFTGRPEPEIFPGRDGWRCFDPEPRNAHTIALYQSNMLWKPVRIKYGETEDLIYN